MDRGKLAAAVFGDDDQSRSQLTYLEGLIHPRTRQRIVARLNQAERQLRATGSPWVAILDVPLLFEVGWDRCCDQIWCVDADRAERRQRARLRGWDEAELTRRESRQLLIDEKKRLSTTVIPNHGSLDELHETIRQMWSSLERSRNRLATDEHCWARD